MLVISLRARKVWSVSSSVIQGCDGPLDRARMLVSVLTITSVFLCKSGFYLPSLRMNILQAISVPLQPLDTVISRFVGIWEGTIYGKINVSHFSGSRAQERVCNVFIRPSRSFLPTSPQFHVPGGWPVWTASVSYHTYSFWLCLAVGALAADGRENETQAFISVALPVCSLCAGWLPQPKVSAPVSSTQLCPWILMFGPSVVAALCYD